jgi:hypothetical protein
VGDYELRRHRLRAAKEAFDRALQLDPALAQARLGLIGELDPDAQVVRARLAIDRGDLASAEAIVAHGPADHAELAELRGQLALARRDGPAATAQFRRRSVAEVAKAVSF